MGPTPVVGYHLKHRQSLGPYNWIMHEDDRNSKDNTLAFYLPLLLFTGSLSSIQDGFSKRFLIPHFFPFSF